MEVKVGPTAGHTDVSLSFMTSRQRSGSLSSLSLPAVLAEDRPPLEFSDALHVLPRTKNYYAQCITLNLISNNKR